MSYSENLPKERAKQNYWAVMTSRRLASGFTLTSGFIYKVDWPYGRVSLVEEDDTELTLGSSATALASGEFFYDRLAKELFVRSTDDSDPDTKEHITVTFQIFVADTARHGFVDPTDSSSGNVFYEPLISEVPELKSRLSDTLFGFLPVESSSIIVGDPSETKLFQRTLFDGSYNKAQILIYQSLGNDLDDTTNFKLVFDGLMSNGTYTLNKVRFTLFDRTDELDNEFRQVGESFYKTATFPNLDSFSSGNSIFYAYGVINGVIPTNIDFVDSTTATVTDNRIWSVIGEQVNLAEINEPVTTGSTTTTTILIGVSLGIRIGDRCFFDRASGTDDFAKITNVTEGGGNTTLTHKDLTGTGGAMTSGDTVKRSFVGALDVFQDGVKYELQFNRDYVSSTGLAGGTAGFTLTDDFEAEHPGLTLFTGIDTIAARIYGPKNGVTISGHGALGSNDTESNNLTNPVVILYDLLRNKLGLPESKIDTQSFIDEEPNVTDAYGRTIPATATGKFDTFKDLVLDISKTSFLRLFLNNDQKWEVGRITDAAATPSKTIRNDEVILKSFRYTFNYKEIASDITVRYAAREVADDPVNIGSSTLGVVSTSNLAKRLHKVNKEVTFETSHFKEADAQAAADRYKFIFGDRLGVISLKVKNRFFDSLINDTIRVSLARLPFDAAFDIDVERSRDTVVQSINKSSQGVTIELSDIKGISDNPGSF